MVVMIICLAAILVVMIIVTVSSHKKQTDSYMKLQNSIAVGDNIIFSNGLHGTITKLDSKLMTVKCGQAELVAERACIQAKIGGSDDKAD